MSRILLVPVLALGLAGCHAQFAARPALTLHTNVEVHADVGLQTAVPMDGSSGVEFFGIPLEGAQDVVFVLDRSGSMSSAASWQVAQLWRHAVPGPVVTKIDVAHQELVQALEALPEGTRMNVIYFNRAVDGFAPAMVPLEGTERARAVEFVRDTTPSGATALAPAIRTALLMNPRRIVLLSDGLGNVGGNNEDILRDVREAIRGGVRIDTIGLGPDQDTQLLSTLATETRGVYQPLQ